jgi:hypothetical protein
MNERDIDSIFLAAGDHCLQDSGIKKLKTSASRKTIDTVDVTKSPENADKLTVNAVQQYEQQTDAVQILNSEPITVENSSTIAGGSLQT